MDTDDYFQCILLQVTFQEPILNIIISTTFILILLLLILLFSLGGMAVASISMEELNKINNNKMSNNKSLKQIIENKRDTIYSLYIAQTVFQVMVVIFFFYILFHLSGKYYYSATNYFSFTIVLIIILFLCNIIIPKYIIRKNVFPVLFFIAPLINGVYRIVGPLTKIGPRIMPLKSRNFGDADNYSGEYAEEKDIFQEIIHFYNKTTEEIMVPRMDMKAVDIKCSFMNLLGLVIKTGFSRIPVYHETEDDIKGILYVKDLLQSIQKPENFEWQSLIRPAYFIPETKKIDDLLEEFRSNKIHIAIVVDEFGCTSGLVTIEDIIEEIVGEISDEYDADKRHFFVLPDGNYIFEGKIQLVDFFRETEIDPKLFDKYTDEVDTLAGMLLKIKGTLPCRREEIDYNGYRFRILEADQRRVLKIKFSKIGKSKKEELSCEA